MVVAQHSAGKRMGNSERWGPLLLGNNSPPCHSQGLFAIMSTFG